MIHEIKKTLRYLNFWISRGPLSLDIVLDKSNQLLHFKICIFITQSFFLSIFFSHTSNLPPPPIELAKMEVCEVNFYSKIDF